MKFSVITVTYNAERHLKESLASVAEQTYGDVEHILWDGGSTDQTLEIARRFPVDMHEGKDVGIADAMNKGAAFATGDFLIHLHADDSFAHPNVLTSLATMLHQHPSVRWIYGRATIVNGAGEPLRETPFEPFSFKRLKKYNFITHPATCVARSLFEEVGGFDASLKLCMDYDLWLRLAQKATPFPLHTLLATFREHQDSLSTANPHGVADEAYQVRNRYILNPLERLRSYRTWKKRRSL